MVPDVLASLSIVVPAYNEAERLPASVQRIIAWADDVGANIEIVVVDDGSSDQTVAIAQQMAVDEPRIRVESLGRNRGKGAAVRRGVSVARKDYILFSDADLSTPIDEVRKLADAIADGADVAIGSRDVADSRIERHQPWYREAMGRTFNRIVRALAVGGISDTQCGFKLFAAEPARRCFSRTTIEGFAFDVEVLFIARKLGYRISEVGVIWVNDERTTVDAFRDSTRMFLDVARIRYRQRGNY